MAKKSCTISVSESEAASGLNSIDVTTNCVLSEMEKTDSHLADINSNVTSNQSKSSAGGKGKEQAPAEGKAAANPKKLVKVVTLEQINKKKRLSPEDVHDALRLVGIESPEAENVSSCLKRAIQRQFIIIEGPEYLDQVVTSVQCYECKVTIDATIRDLIEQPDYGGDYYEDGGYEAPVKCPECDQGIYVTRICEGNPEGNSGKFHNHCQECEGFGQCIGDYRMAHCEGCENHYFRGLYSYPCPNCKENDSNDEENGFNDCPIS